MKSRNKLWQTIGKTNPKRVKQNNKKRLSNDYHFYNSRSWRDYSKQILEKPENVLCRECYKEDILTPSAMVDHIIPIRLGGSKRDERNLQGLCNHHHAVKRGRESHGFVAEYTFNHKGEKIPI